MAALALRSEGATVSVILTMAAEAVGGNFETLRALDSMARFALQLCVCAGQRVVGLSRMVITPLAPCGRVMTGLASRSRAETPLVKILMATFTRR